MENRQHDGVVVMVEKNSSRASPKHRGKTNMLWEREGSTEAQTCVGCPPSTSLYIGGRRRGGRPRVSPRGPAARARGGGGGQGRGGGQALGFPPLGALPPKPGGVRQP